MNLKKSKADLFHRELIHSNNHRTDQIIGFLRKEANSLCKLRILIKQCVDDTSYDYNFSLMEEEINNIRTNKLLLLRDQFGIFDFKEKKYFHKLLTDLHLI